MTGSRFRPWIIGLILVSGLLPSNCSHDTYRARADVLKDHTEAFYAHLKANRVEAAVRENEQIEAMASEMEQTIRKQAAQRGTALLEREFALMKTAKETAASNWLALGQYFAVKKQYAQARTTYQRVLNTYSNPTDRSYREQAARALEDLDILNPPTAKATKP